ncbi:MULTISPECIES: phosphatase PAP2 family protein [Rhizobium]|uniref:Undecaprenyl-diphosphatase n=1 Tax=Rhizobium dioscoreae TaxID=2653122 RepID=A0ABQ0Z2R8_9HYPH|nr:MULTISPECIES: phosphatase PAP2 family protein [Rhizobium]MCZ3379487.1 phosphatase PAP2 family protein [Rhizobium sp. AG207R]GES49784.1 undecaprenyl-diphosphatase [Rhizobium dioscoreae]GLU84028.1 undecaprenyl-diphosphatase [Rhizobium sp. NBRC 114257]
MYGLDVVITEWINGIAGNPTVDSLMILITAYGVPLLIVLVAVQWWVGERRSETRHALVAAGLTFVIGLGINQVILFFVSRVRPYDVGVTKLLINRSNDPSFPSDHATAAFAIVAAFALQRMPERSLFFLLGAILVSFSRVYVGTHYVGDVMGGVLTAVFAAILVKTLYRPETRLDRFVTGIL